MKKILALLITIIVFASVLPVVFADEAGSSGGGGGGGASAPGAIVITPVDGGAGGGGGGGGCFSNGGGCSGGGGYYGMPDYLDYIGEQGVGSKMIPQYASGYANKNQRRRQNTEEMEELQRHIECQSTTYEELPRNDTSIEITSIQYWSDESATPSPESPIGYEIVIKNTGKNQVEAVATVTVLKEGWPYEWESTEVRLLPLQTHTFKNSIHKKVGSKNSTIKATINYIDWKARTDHRSCDNATIDSTWHTYTIATASTIAPVVKNVETTSPDTETLGKRIQSEEYDEPIVVTGHATIEIVKSEPIEKSAVGNKELQSTPSDTKNRDTGLRHALSNFLQKIKESRFFN